MTLGEGGSSFWEERGIEAMSVKKFTYSISKSHFLFMLWKTFTGEGGKNWWFLSVGGACFWGLEEDRALEAKGASTF